MARKRAKSAAWPVLDSPLLADVAAAFLRRRKAIAYRVGEVSCGREFSESASETFERFNLDLCGGHLRLSVWEDGCVWVSVCVRAAGRNAGWAFQDAFHGDARDVSATTLVGMVESTLQLKLGTDSVAGREQLRAIWGRVYPRTS
jgi:hypothetical protein